MDNQTKETTALHQLLTNLPTPQPSKQLRGQILRSFAPFCREESFSFGVLLRTLFGEQLHSRKLALVSVLVLIIFGGVGGYAGADMYLNNTAVSDLMAQAFSNQAFMLESEAGT